MPKIAKNYGNIEGTAPKTKADVKRVRYSRFLLTWVSNKSFTDTNDPAFKELESKAERYFERMLSDDKIYDYIVMPEGHAADKIKSIEVDASFEIGPEKRIFHSHIYIGIDHYSKLQLNRDKIRTETQKEIIEGGYINIAGSPDSARGMRDYIHKFQGNNPALQ